MAIRKNTAKAKAVAITYPAHKALFVALFTLAIYLLLSGAAFAQSTPMGDVLCTVVSFVIDGNLGRGLATIAIIVLGVGALLGKASWGLALTVGVGISVIFGAPDIVDKLVDASAC